MNYREALAWLFGTQLFGIKLGLENTGRLLAELDLPAPAQRIVHVAGTNGKGSVCAMIESICRAQGYRTGLFTSPHLVTFRERIQVCGMMISQAETAAGLTLIRDLMRHWDPHPTFFEITTALGLHHFRLQQCDIVVLETGMGGRLDATNAITPAVAVITPIDLDHQKWLGDTLTEIAAEKAGIIKPGLPVVSARQHPGAETVLQEKAASSGSALHFVRHDETATALAGSHQRENASLAVAALRAGSIRVTPEAIENGLATVQWPARFQRWNDLIIIDGAHNPAGARVLANTWRETYGNDRATIVLAVLCDKDASGIAQALLPIATRFVLPRAQTERALPPSELAAVIATADPGISTTIAASIEAALIEAGADPSRVLLTGSLHFAGEALATLNGNPDDFEECVQ